MLKHGDPNPLNVFGLRQVDTCPPHFEKTTFNLSAEKRTISNWIYENLESRFYLEQVRYYNTETKRTALAMCVGFEDPGELVLFCLSLDKFNTF